MLLSYLLLTDDSERVSFLLSVCVYVSGRQYILPLWMAVESVGGEGTIYSLAWQPLGNGHQSSSSFKPCSTFCIP